MIWANIFSAFEIVRGPGSGISMSSRRRPWEPFSCRSWEAKRARFCFLPGLDELPASRLMRSGSSRSASWSTRSPVSLQTERSESEDGVSNEDRALSLSWSSSR
ncbi:hypothetical protein IG631_13092 [Alternaria alternata]|nr:hypothetical protein IG631_13092 [Alternaria alternata]